MDERRKDFICSQHHELVSALNTMNGKLDSIIERQLEYAERSIRIESKQERLEQIVTNGLSHNVASIAKRLDTFCEEVKKRLDELEEFQWFRIPVTKIRDSMFWYIIKFAVLGGIIYLVIHYGSQIIDRIF